EHRALLTRLSLVANERLENERMPRRADPLRHSAELLPLQHRPEVRHRHELVLYPSDVLRLRYRGGAVTAYLAAEEVEVDPGIGAPALATSEDPAVEAPRRGEVGDEKCVMERAQGIGHRSSAVAVPG